MLFAKRLISAGASLLIFAACNNPPKSRPGAGDVLPKQSPTGGEIIDADANADADGTDEVEELQEKEKERQKLAEEEDAKKASEPGTATKPTESKAVAFTPKEVTATASGVLVFEHANPDKICMLSKNQKLKILSAPKETAPGSEKYIVDVEKVADCGTRVVLQKRDWSGL